MTKDQIEHDVVTYAGRCNLTREPIPAITALWTERDAYFHGLYLNFDNVSSYPNPATHPQPPLVLATFASKFRIHRFAKYADGWIPINALHENLPADIDYLKTKLKDYGRDVATFPISIFDIEQTSEEDLKRFADIEGITRAIPRCPTEDKDTVLKWLDKYAKIGEGLN